MIPMATFLTSVKSSELCSLIGEGKAFCMYIAVLRHNRVLAQISICVSGLWELGREGGLLKNVRHPEYGFF